MKKIKCDHCHLSYDEDILIKDTNFSEEKFFCCKGCQGVYHILNEQGLDSFYDKMGRNTIKPPSAFEDDFDKFDLQNFKEKYVKKQNGFSEISLVIEGIHCSACVWLNEKVLHKLNGVVEASVNGTTHKAKIIWDDDTIKLSSIIKTIQNIGYKATPYDPHVQEIRINALKRQYNSRLLVGVFCTMNIMWIAVALYAGYYTGISENVKAILHFAEFVLATPALFYTGWVFFRGGYFGLKNRFVNMDLLVAIGASSAYLFSLYAMFSKSGEVYFDSVAMIVTFIFAGKYLEVITQKKASDTLDTLTNSLPSEVVVVSEFGTQKQSKTTTPVQNVKIGEIIQITAGDKIVIDGILIEGEASFDESSINGESVLKYKQKNDEILSGSVCVDGVIYYKSKKIYNESMLYKITTLLEKSMLKKPHIEQLANQISGYFSLTILVLAFSTFFAWYFFTGSFEHALIVGISVIVIACPCALGLATPVSTLVGLGIAVKKRILFKQASFLESMAKSTYLALDKTGTITYGKPQVQEYKQYLNFDKNLLFSLLQLSSHPVSRGILHYFKEENLQTYHLQDVKIIASKGVEARYNDVRLIGGNSTFLSEFGIHVNKLDMTEYFFCIDDKLICSFMLEDLPKQDAKNAILQIHNLKVSTIMLTGDNEISAKKVANEVGIDKFKSSLLPIQKALEVEKLSKNHIVVMVGDGINDSLALSKSNIAISMGSGADVALSVSDVVLLDDDVNSLVSAFKISKRVYKTIKQNLTFSLLYNVVTIPLAMAGFINPLFAAISMSLSSIVVVLNSMRMKMMRL